MNKVLCASFFVFQVVIAGQHSELQKVVVCKNLRNGLIDQLYRQRVNALSDDKDSVESMQSSPFRQCEKTKKQTKLAQCQENAQLREPLIAGLQHQRVHTFSNDKDWVESMQNLSFEPSEKVKKQIKLVQEREDKQLQQRLLDEHCRRSDAQLYDKDWRGSIHVMPFVPVKKTKKQIIVLWLKEKFLFCCAKKDNTIDSGYDSHRDTVKNDEYAEYDSHRDTVKNDEYAEYDSHRDTVKNDEYADWGK